MLLLDENQEVLTLVTNSLKKYAFTSHAPSVVLIRHYIVTSIIRTNTLLDLPYVLLVTLLVSRCHEICFLRLKVFCLPRIRTFAEKLRYAP